MPQSEIVWEDDSPQVIPWTARRVSLETWLHNGQAQGQIRVEDQADGEDVVFTLAEFTDLCKAWLAHEGYEAVDTKLRGT